MNWETWGTCTADCDGGIHSRTRKCQNDETGLEVPSDECTEGDKDESGECNMQLCPTCKILAVFK